MTRVHEAVKAIALCHNVTPVVDDQENKEGVNAGFKTDERSGGGEAIELKEGPDAGPECGIVYQAASPDEVALVQWTEVDSLYLFEYTIFVL